jgi:hypothetical protein
MKLPHQLLVKLSPLVEAARGEPLIEPFVEVAEHSEARLVLRSSYGLFSFDKAQRVITRDEVEVSGFDGVLSVDIGAFPGGRGEKSWSVVLFRGLVDRITIGRTYDDGEASVVAAKVAQVLGCKVVSLAIRR